MGNVNMIMYIISLLIFFSSLFILFIGISCFLLPLYVNLCIKLFGSVFKWKLLYGTIISVDNYVDINNKLKPNYTMKYNLDGVDYSVRLNKVGSKKNIGDKVKLIYFQKSNRIKSGEIGKLNLIFGSIITVIGIICLLIGIYSLSTYWIPII